MDENQISNFFEELRLEDPAFVSVYNDLLGKYDEVIPHLFLGTWTIGLKNRYLTGKSKVITANVENVIQKYLNESGRRGEKFYAVQNLIFISFIEPLYYMTHNAKAALRRDISAGLYELIVGYMNPK